MLEALILDNLERSQLLEPAIRGVDVSYSNHGDLNTSPVARFMSNAVGSYTGLGTSNPFVFEGYSTRTGFNDYEEAPYWAPIAARWFFTHIQSNLNATSYSFNPATDAFSIEEPINGRNLERITEDPSGVIWAVSFASGYAGVYRRTGVGAWTQVLPVVMGYYSGSVWHDGVPYFVTDQGAWYAPSGNALITSPNMNPGIAIGNPNWANGNIFGFRNGGAKPRRGRSNQSKFNRLSAIKGAPAHPARAFAQIRKVGLETVLATLPQEALDVYAQMPTTGGRNTGGTWTNNDCAGSAIWLPVPQTSYYLHIVIRALIAPVAWNYEGAGTRSSVNEMYVSILNVATGGSQYLGLISRPSPGLYRASNSITDTEYYVTESVSVPIAAGMSDGKLRIYAPVTHPSPAGSSTDYEWALARLDIDARISI